MVDRWLVRNLAKCLTVSKKRLPTDRNEHQQVPNPHGVRIVHQFPGLTCLLLPGKRKQHCARCDYYRDEDFFGLQFGLALDQTRKVHTHHHSSQVAALVADYSHWIRYVKQGVAGGQDVDGVQGSENEVLF